MAVALAANPRLLLLDEPVTGMNPVETMETMDHIKRIAKERAISILIVEHDMKAVMSVCERIIVLSFGAKIAEGSPDEIMTNRQVIEAYLGSEYGRLE
jgi:branched-chain amino acid transport system ATP-binding protein